MDIEIVRAHETNRPFFPLLSEITHDEFVKCQPKWAHVLGSVITYEIPSGDCGVNPAHSPATGKVENQVQRRALERHRRIADSI